MNRHLFLTFLAFPMVLLCAILPADRATVWNPGLNSAGGIPQRTTIYTTIQASTYGNGVEDATAGIQTAIDACPSGQVVLLSEGTFLINSSFLLINKGITLRGSGTGKTILKRTNGAVPGTYTSQIQMPNIIIGPNRWPWPTDNSENLTADGAKGDFSVTIAAGGGFAAGQVVLLDEDNYNTGSWQSLPNRGGLPTTVTIWATDRVTWARHNPTTQYVDDPFPDATSWFMRTGRPVSEIKEIASVSGNIITFTTPLHIGYRVTHTAQLSHYQYSHVKNAGVEDLTTVGGSDGQVRFETAAYCWMKNVEDSSWLGEGVGIQNSFRIEVRDSYIHGAVWPNPGGGGYAISLASGASEVLIENNIIMNANKVMVARCCGAGSVVGYNYTDNGHIGYDSTWQEVGINGSHMVGPHHMLFEGNYSFNYDADFTHGAAIYHTVFRNHLSGYRRDFSGMGNGRSVGLAYGSWWHSFAGNVLGTEGRTSGWVYQDSGSPAWGQAPAIWRLGYDPTEWDQAPDPKVLSTVLRHGNYDYVTNTVHWDANISDHTLPNSLYLTSKPAFFGNCIWPWVTPEGTTKLYSLPAKNRFEGLAPCSGTPITPLRTQEISMSGPAVFALYNVNGQTIRVFKDVFNGNIDNVRLLEIERTLPNGLYLLKITGQGFSVSVKRIVAR